MPYFLQTWHLQRHVFISSKSDPIKSTATLKVAVAVSSHCIHISRVGSSMLRRSATNRTDHQNRNSRAGVATQCQTPNLPPLLPLSPSHLRFHLHFHLLHLDHDLHYFFSRFLFPSFSKKAICPPPGPRTSFSPARRLAPARYPYCKAFDITDRPRIPRVSDSCVLGAMLQQGTDCVIKGAL